jgi:hypothetical protein
MKDDKSAKVMHTATTAGEDAPLALYSDGSGIHGKVGQPQ